MSAARVVVIGGGEHARVVIEAIRAAVPPLELAGFVDPTSCEETARRLAVRRLGDDRALEGLADAHGILGFGTIETRDRRLEVVCRLSGSLAGWAIVVHRAAWVSPTATLGEGTVVMAGAVVQTGARVGAHSVINTGVIIEHDAVVGENVQIAPGVTLGGGVVIGDGAYLGLGGSVRDHVQVGAGAVIGMGAVVVRDVPPEARVKGVPAR